VNQLYSSPFRVYLLLAVLAFAGIVSGLKLPVSLFPNSSKPEIVVRIPYSSQTAEEFSNVYGKRLEDQLRAISHSEAEVERVESKYESQQVKFKVFFHWGASDQTAKKEVEMVANSFASMLPEDSRNGMWIWPDNENTGFFAMSFYSEKRDLNAVYDLLEPLLTPKLSRIKDASKPGLHNPLKREIHVNLKPEVMASLQLFPSDIERSVVFALQGRTGGSITVGLNQVSVEMPRQVKTVEDLGQILITTPAGRAVHLSDIATINVGTSTTDARIFKTSGVSSLILFATPKPGGNIKQMSEEMLAVVKETMPSLPSDIQYKVLVDPSEFIRSSVNNVFHEVGIAAMLAVFVLFLFIGSIRNVITAAIEIPLSMVLAFILMRMSGMNLNLISLGGLALSAGMNVDASVVVMENIFRHFENEKGPMDFARRLQITVSAVREVRFAVIASTITSLVVFLPLIFTSDLSHAILGDLAMAVVFSHGFSAFVALLLVPTVRLHLMAKGGQQHSSSPIEKHLKRLESWYSTRLAAFIASPRAKTITYFGLTGVLLVLAVLVLPRLPREIIGKPDTDWVMVGMNTEGNAVIKQMELMTEEIERDLLKSFGDEIKYTFTQITGINNSFIMARLKNKSKMREIQKRFEEKFVNTPSISYWVDTWNPSELQIPDPPQLQVAVRGGTSAQRAEAAKEVRDLLEEKKAYPRIEANPSVKPEKVLFIDPHKEQWMALQTQGHKFSPSDVVDLLRVGTLGRRVGYFPWGNEDVNIMVRYPSQYVSSVEELASFPIGIGPKLVPLKALAEIHTYERPPSVFREDGRDLYYIKGRTQAGEAKKNSELLLQAEKLIKEWNEKRLKAAGDERVPSVTIEDAAKDLTDAINQLSLAVAISIGLIYLTMLIQFGTWVEPLLVLVSVPLGFIGVLVSLFVFQSTLSLNSVLGIILLNGIAVANSIILVDFIKRLVAEGLPPRTAAVEAAKKRLRPILITSLTTVLGMLPIAIGAGEGGRILQPLGIAVAGGLWISMMLTLFLVPALQVGYLESRGLKLPAFRFPTPWKKLAKVSLVFFISLSAFGGATEESKTLSFNEALKTILERSTSIASQKETKEAVEARNWSSKYSLLPSVSLSAAENRYKTPQQSTNVEKRIYGVTGNLNLIHFGADIAAMSAAANENEAQEHLVNNAVLLTEEQAVRVLLAALQAQATVKSLEKNLRTREEAWNTGRERYKRGLLALQEADKLLIDRDNAEARLRDSEIELSRANASLQQLLDHNRVTPEWPWKQSMEKAENHFTKQEAKGLAQRPDWQAAQKTVDGAHARKRQSLGLALPSLDLSLTYGHADYKKPAPTASGIEWQGMLTLSFPIFDRLASLGAYRAAVHSAYAADFELEKIRRLAKAEWTSSKESFLVAYKSALSREKTLETTQKLYDTNSQRFRRGLINANELMIDQDRLYQAEQNAIRGWNEAHLQLMLACHALGQQVSVCLN
jgi:hydrophobic/amphiphilic exporter-1 (mainly G- bacteria), HAE1 family